MENTKLFTVGKSKNGVVVSESIGKSAMGLLKQLVKGQDKNPEDPKVKQVPHPDEWNPCLQHVLRRSSEGKVLTPVRKPTTPSSSPVSEEKTPSSEGVVVEDPADEDDLYA
jgi:hypothetical protein